jgi:glycosyltransferase involved in cell wall biosynthesis
MVCVMSVQAHAISVIIPLYNKAGYIMRAVRSVLAQWPQPGEVLVIDDGSTDQGPALLASAPECANIRVIRQDNAGEGAARNRGLQEMNGQLAAFLDADDEWLPGHLQNLLDLVHQYPEAGLFATGYRTVYQRAVVVETALDRTCPLLLPDYFAAARGSFCLHISSCLVWRDVALDAGGFAEAESLGADLEFFARIALRRSVALHPTISGIYYACHPGSAIHAAEWNGGHPPAVRLLNQVTARLPLTPSMEAYADWLLSEHALTGLCSGRRQEAIRLLTATHWGHRLSPQAVALIRAGMVILPLGLIKLIVRWRRSRFSVSNKCRPRRVVTTAIRRTGVAAIDEGVSAAQLERLPTA